jgi:hypothetical protein
MKEKQMNNLCEKSYKNSGGIIQTPAASGDNEKREC